MLRYVFVLLGLLLVYEGWVYYSDPQRAYRLDNWPFAPKGTEGVSEDAGSTYRIRGAVMMAAGAVTVAASLWGLLFG